MQFDKTETCLNLARSFAGESQAGMRYQLIAKLATAEGYAVLADTIRSIAKNETYHAKTFFDTIIQKAGSSENAAMDERAEFEEIYPSFAETAEKEGFKDIAALWRMVAEVEQRHNVIFSHLYGAVKDGTLYKNDSPVVWVCSECGYRATTKEAWHICPLCKASQGFVEIRLPFDNK